MKKLFSILLFGVLFSISTYAQKLGHINSAELLSEMPEIKQADQKLEQYKKQLEEQNQAMLTEYQNKIQEYQQKEALMADAIKEVRQKEILDLEKRIQEFQVSAQQKLTTKKEELYNPTLQKAEDAIKAVAKEKGYAYIFDTSLGAVIYAQPTDDVISLVKTKLGL